MLTVLRQSGCVAHHQIQPVVEGRLTDSAGQPVQGAEMTLDRICLQSVPCPIETVFFLSR